MGGKRAREGRSAGAGPDDDGVGLIGQAGVPIIDGGFSFATVRFATVRGRPRPPQTTCRVAPVTETSRRRAASMSVSVMIRSAASSPAIRAKAV
jgi:hypothetical protein